MQTTNKNYTHKSNVEALSIVVHDDEDLERRRHPNKLPRNPTLELNVRDVLRNPAPAALLARYPRETGTDFVWDARCEDPVRKIIEVTYTLNSVVILIPNNFASHTARIDVAPIVE